MSVKQKGNRKVPKTAWKKGQSGNPNGRPKKDQSILELIRKKLKVTCEYDSSGRTWLEALAEAEMRMALKDTAARKDLFDRLMGKAPDSLLLGGDEDNPVFISLLSKLRGYDNEDTQ